MPAVFQEPILRSKWSRKRRWAAWVSRATSHRPRSSLLLRTPRGSRAKRCVSRAVSADGDGQDRKLMIENKVVLITGVSSGIGRETAQLLAERGARVFGTVRDLGRADPIAEVEFVPMDVTDDKSVNAAVQSIVQKTGPIQYLVNNAGYHFMGALEETSVAEARQQFETNLFGVLRVTNAILPGMRQQGFG